VGFLFKRHLFDLGSQIEDLPGCLCAMHGQAVTAEQADLFQY
jgi:hypothetical protein